MRQRIGRTRVGGAGVHCVLDFVEVSTRDQTWSQQTIAVTRDVAMGSTCAWGERRTRWRTECVCVLPDSMGLCVHSPLHLPAHPHVPEKARELDKHISRLKEVQDLILRRDLGQANMDYARRSVEREERFLRSEFYYNKIKKYMKNSFNDEDTEIESVEVKGG